MEDPRPDETLGTAEQRRHDRQPEPGTVSMSIAACELSGRKENVSAGGIMLVSDASLRVAVEIEQDGDSVLRTGRLVRVQRMNAAETAYAIEFDDA